MTDGIELDVVEADEADRGVARLPEAARRRLGALSGDPVIVEGESPVVATVWPASGGLPDDAVALSRRTRRRAGVEAGDAVRIRTAAIDDATAITVEAPASLGSIEEAVETTLEDRPVSVGDRLRVEGEPVRVTEVRPGGTVRITPATDVRVRTVSGEEEPLDRETVSGVHYDDIGGLDEELDLVREAVELPLAEPELFDRLGIDPPSGVLLYGPPGTGKTLIAEAVANAVDATFYHVSGPEITSKYKGESEERLREVFERARESSPAIVFFDEIDAVAAERDDAGDMENRVVAQLLSLMDGLEARGDVIVIGATNRVDTLDPALRRPGRFDREIEIGVPDEEGRREVLEIHARDVPLAEGVDLDDLAARTHGFVGADLRALVTEAAMEALRRAREEGDDPGTVTREDVETALASIEPSAMREFVAETPETGFEEVGGLEEAKDTLREAVEWPLSHPGLFEATNTDPPSGILLYGPPGTGKTLLARAVASESDVNFVHVAGPELVDKYVGESEKAVREVFDRARQAAPSVVFFDEIDAIASQRGESGDSDVTERVVSQLLTELDGLADNPGLVVLAATNRREAIDPALLRPGRLETHVEVPLPDLDAREAILEVHARGKPLGEDVDLPELAEELEGASGADLEALVREASMRAIREAASEHGPDEAEERAEEIAIERRHFETAREAVDVAR